MLPAGEAYAFGAICALALFASVVAHEFAHALVARRFGVRTDAITLFLFGGVATLEREPATPKGDAVIALAGPVMSAVLAVVALAATFAVDRFIGNTGVRDALGLLGTYLTLANGVLALFNLLPAYPMDGGRILRAAVWHGTRDRAAATTIASRVGIGFALLFVAAGVFTALAAHNALYAWYVVLGAFLLRQGWSEERASRRARLPSAEVTAAA
jgi:Zn-dependent protease